METKNQFTMIYTDDVKQYGLIRAAIIGKIKKWCDSNAKAKRYNFDGFHWSGHITVNEIADQIGLPFETVKKNLKWLIDNNVIIKANYNKFKYDRTNWYRPNGIGITDTMQQACKEHNHRPERTKGLILTGPLQYVCKEQTIPNTPYEITNNPPNNLPKNPVSNNPFVELTKSQRDKLTPAQQKEYWMQLEIETNKIKQYEK